MIIFAKHGGQLCNRLWSIYPAYTFARAHKKKLYVLFSDPSYLSLFPDARKDKNAKFLFTSQRWHKVRFMEWVTSRLEKKEIIGELRDYDSSSQKHGGIQHISGWVHHSDISYSDDFTFRKSFKSVFSFDAAVQERVKSIMLGYDGKTVGVHVRRGDYRQWKNGRYYYDDSIWARIMIFLQNQLNAMGFRCRFLICSNEPWNYKDDKLDIFQIPDSDGITDLCALSHCDYIIGPPSTYSQWASFVGDVPLRFILSPDDIVELRDFSPIFRQDVFVNGKSLRWDENRGQFFIGRV